MKEKVCGNCRCFNNEDVYGFGWCDKLNEEVHCGLHYDCHEDLNGWTEITQDNVEELYDKPVAIAWEYDDKKFYRLAGDCTISLSTMAKSGGYYYYVLPELKIGDYERND